MNSEKRMPGGKDGLEKDGMTCFVETFVIK